LSAATSGWLSVRPRDLERGKVGFCLRQRGAGPRPTGTGQRSRRSGELAVERSERALGGGKIGLDAAQLGARCAELGGDRRRAANEVRMLGFEREAALLGLLEFLLPLRQLLVEERDRLAHLAAAPPRFSSRKMSIIRCAMSCASCAFSPSTGRCGRSRGDLEHVLVVADDLDVFGQRSTARSICAGVVTVSPIRVERTTFSKLTALVSVWRMRSMSFLRLSAPMPIWSASASSSWT
jgi:hypothetical protein